MKIKPVILCGGSGTRLWPKSKNNQPKQFIENGDACNSNFGGWILGSPGVNNIAYAKDFNGLVECYILAIPFFGNTFLSTLIFAYPAIFIYKTLPARSSSRQF